MRFQCLVLFFLAGSLVACKGEKGGGGSGYQPPASQPPSAPPPVTSPVQHPLVEPLVLQSISPAVVTNVSVNQVFELTFSQPVDPSSVITNAGPNLNTISIYSGDSLNHYGAIINATVSGNRITITPTYDLMNRLPYKLVISGALLSVNGQSLGSERVHEFMSGVAPGANPGDQVSIRWEQEGHLDEVTGDFIDKFLLSFGRSSSQDEGFVGYENQDYRVNEEPMLNGPFTGTQVFRTDFRYSFPPNTTYFFVLRACSRDGLCSPDSNELTVNF